MTSDLELDKDTEGRISMFSKFVEDSIQEMFAYLLSREQRLKEAQIGMFEHLIEEASQQLLSPERYKQYSSQRPLLNDLSSELNLYASKSLNDAIQNGEALPKLNDDSEQVHKERYLTIMNSLVLSDTQQISLTDFMNTIYIRESFLLRSRRSGISMDYFYLLKDIGSGAYASVHLVKHKFSGQLFALKKINKSKMKNLSDRIRLRIERCIMMRIRSSFIVGLHYAFYDDENIYFVMDYAAGGDMKSLLDIVGSVSEGWARRWFAEIVCAVLTLHGHIAHRGERHLDLHQNQPNAEVVNEIMADEARREANSHCHSSNSSDSNSSEFNDLTASAKTNELSSHFTDSVLFEIQAKASLRSESAQPKVSLPLGSSPILSEAQRSAISSLQKAKLALQSSKVNANKIPAFSTGKLAPLPNASFHQVSFDKMFLKFAIPPIPPPVVDVTPMNLVEKSDISNLIPPVPPIFSSKQSKQGTKTVAQKSLLSRMETAPTIDVDDSSSSSQQNQNSSHILSAKHYLLHTSSETPSGSVQRDSAGISENTTFTLNGLLSGLNQTSLWQPDSEDCIEAAPPAENVETTEASFLDGRDTDSSFILASRTRIENSSQRNLLVPGLSSSALGRPMIINAPPPEHSGDASLDCTTVHHIPNLALNGFRIPSHSLPSERFSLSSTTTQNLPRMQPSGHTMSLSTTNVLKNQQPAVKPTAPRCSQPIDPRSSQALPPKPPVPPQNLPCDESKQLIDIFVHRDLKPLNFLFRDDGHILLADFGLAEQLPSVDEGASPLIEAVKVSERQTSATRISSTRETSSLLVGEREIVGTVEYMAPEIFNAPAYGRSVDYWALGLILYELLTGEVAFVASSPDELVQRLAAIKTEEDYDKCVSRPDFISDEAWDLIRGLMAHPTKRYGCSQHLHSLMDHPFFTRGYSRNQILNYQTPELQELIYAYKSYEETEAVEHTNEPFQFDEDLLDRLPVYPDEEFLYTLPTHWRPRTNNDADLKLFNERELKICGIIANDSGRYQAESLSEPDSESDSTSSDPVLLVPRSRDGNLSSRMSVRRSVHATKKLREILRHIPVETYKKARVRAEDPGAYSSVYHYTGGRLDENLVPSNVSSFSVDYLAGAASVVKDLLHSASSPTSRASCLDGSKIGTTGSSLNNMARNVDGLLANQNCDFPSHIRYNSEDSDNQDLIGDEGIRNQNITDLYSLSSKTELTGLDSLEIATSSLSKVKMARHLSVAAPRMIVTDDSDQNRTFTTDEEDHLKTISQVSSKSSITTLLPVTDDEHLFTSLVEIIFQLGLDLDIEDMESSTEEAIVGLKSFALLTIVKDAHYNIPPCTFNTVVQSLQTASCLKDGRRITEAPTGKDSSLLKHGLIYSTSRLSGSVFSYDSKPPTGIISGRIFNEDDTQQNSTDVPVSLTAALPDPCTQITGQASGIYSDSFPSFDVQSFHSVPLSMMSRNVDIKLIHIQEKMLTLSNKYLPNLFASSLESQRAVPPICEDPVSSALCIPYNKRTCVANAKSGTFFDWRHYTGFVTCIPNAPYISLETQVGCALGASVSLAIHLSQLGPKASKDCDSIFDSSRNINAASISVLSSPIPSCSPQYDGGGIAAAALSDVSSCPSLTSLVLRVDSVSSSMSQLCEIPGLDDMSKSSAVGCTHAPVDTYQQPADLVCNELSQRSTSSLKSPYEAAIESSFILPMSLKGSFYRENTGSLIELHTDTLVKNPPKSQSHSVKALGYALSQTSSPNELQTFMDTEIRTEGTPESVGILAQKTITSSFERPSGQISALDSDAPLSREECKEATSKTSSFEGRQETCTSHTAVLNSVEEMKSADLFRSNPTEAKAASCNAVCNETSSQGIERQSTSRGSEKEVEFDASQDQLGGLPAPEAAGFSVGSNISLRIPNEPARSTNFSLSRITSDCTVSDSSSFRPPPLSIVIPSTKFPENFGNICFTLGRAKQDETSEISSAVPFRTSVPKLIPPYQLQGAPRITSSKDRRYRLHVGSARRAVNAQDPSCSQGQSEKFPLGTSESISTQLSIPLCPDVQPAPVIVSPNRLTTPQNATSVSLPLKKVPYTQLPLITQLASLPFPVTNSTKSESSRPKAARVFPIITGKMPDIMPITTASLQSGTAIPAVQKETPANKKKDSDHSQLDYNSMESNEESYYYYSDSSSEDSNDVHSTHASSTTVIDLDVRHNNHLTEDSAIYKDAQAFKHIPTGNVRNDRQNTSITPVYIPPTLPLTGDSIVSPLVYSDKAPYSTDFQRLRPAPFLPQTPSSDSNISLVTAPLGQDSKDLCSLSRTSLSQNSATATTEFRVNVKTPRTCDTGNPSSQQSVRHALSNSSILRNPNLQSTLRQNKSVDFDGKHLSKLGHTVITADCLESRHVRLSQVETQRSTSSMSEDDANIASGELFSESRYNNRQSTTSAGFEAAEKRAKGQTTASSKDRVSFSGRDTIVEFPHTEGESHSIIICQNDGSANLACTHPSGDFISDGSACSLYKQGHLSASAKDVVSCSTHEETTPTVKNSLTSNRSQGGNILPNNAHKLQNNLSQNKLESSAKHHSVGDVSLPARKNTAVCGREEKQSGDLHATNAFRPKSRAQSKTPYFTSKHETSANSVEMADFLGLEFVAGEDTQYANKALRSNRSFVRALEMVPQSNRHSQSTTDCHSGEITVTAPSETK